MPQQPQQPQQDPYASIAQPIAGNSGNGSDPYASIAQPVDSNSQSSALDRVAAKLPGSPDTSLQGAVHHLGDAWDTVKSLAKPMWDVSAPAIGEQVYKRLSGQPNDLKQLPGKMITQFTLMGGAAPEGDAEALTGARQAAPAVTESEGSGSGMLGRAWEKLKSRIPGVKAYRDFDYVINGPKETPAPAPKPTPAPVPDTWGKGAYGTPVDQWGQRISQPGSVGSITQSVSESQPVPIQRGSLKQMMNDLQDQIGQGLGASPPPNPKAPIYQRGGLSSALQQGSDILEGHTPVQSSALKSYKYDPETRTFEASFNSGGVPHRYGDVSPEEFQEFEQAKSKGQAFQKIKNSGTPMAKYINGKWEPIRAKQPAQ